MRGASIAGLRVRRGAVDLTPEIFGVAVPVDAGTMVVRAEAPGHRPLEKTVEIAKGAGRTEVVIDALERDATAAAAAPAPAPATAPPSSGGIGTLGIVGFITGGVGLLGLGASAIVMASAKTDYDDAVQRCPNATCASDADKAAVDEARGTGDLGTAIFIGGAALTAFGVTLVVVDVSTGSEPAARTALSVAPGRAALVGTF